MALLSTALLIAALVALLGGGLVALGIAAERLVRHERLALAEGGSIGAGRRASWGAAAHAGALAALALLLMALIARTVATGHAPWSNLHEFSAAFAAGLLATYAALERRHPIRGLAPLVMLLAAGLVGLALSFDDRVEPLVPALQQPVLLTVHVGSAMVAYAISAVAFVAAIGELAQRRMPGLLAALPDAATCRAVAHRSVLLAFPILTLAIVLGAVWANLAWRAYWSNDPKELAAAATWLVYGTYLHAAGRRDRWGSAAPWLLVLGFGGVLFTFIGASLIFVGEHSYAAP